MASKVKEKPPKVEADEQVEEEFDDLPGDSGHFTREEFDEQWRQFAQRQKDAGKDQASITLKEPYELHDNKVIITLSNDVLKITFDRIKADLQGFLRTNLKNGKIILEAIVSETAQEDMIYTNKEKFTHLAKKHPALKELQEKLGLDPDY